LNVFWYCKFTDLTALASMQLLTDLPPLQYEDLTFYPRNAVRSAVSAVVRCLCVCPLHAGIVSKRLNLF